MKKQILIAIALILTLNTYAQKKNTKVIVPIDSSTNDVAYSKVILVDGVSKDELYNRAKEWYVMTYNSAKEVLQLDDKNAGKIIGKGTTSGVYRFMMSNTDFYLNYTLSVTVKDGRYRYEFSQFTVETVSKHSVGGRASIMEYLPYYAKEKGILYSAAKVIIPHMDEEINRLSASLQAAMSKSSSGIKSKDDF